MCGEAMNPADLLNRRELLNRFGMGLGGMALANLVNPSSAFASLASGSAQDRGVLAGPETREFLARECF